MAEGKLILGFRMVWTFEEVLEVFWDFFVWGVSPKKIVQSEALKKCFGEVYGVNL